MFEIQHTFRGSLTYFLKFKGVNIGKSRVEEDKLSVVEEIYKQAEKRNVKIYLPVDHMCAETFAEGTPALYVATEDIPESLMALDIGQKSRELFTKIITGSQVVIWNGPMGVFEWDAFSLGTKAVAEALTKTKGISIVGGGDSAAAIHKFHLEDQVSHVSTGGGASLELLEGKDLPGIRVLRK